METAMAIFIIAIGLFVGGMLVYAAYIMAYRVRQFNPAYNV